MDSAVSPTTWSSLPSRPDGSDLGEPCCSIRNAGRMNEVTTAGEMSALVVVAGWHHDRGRVAFIRRVHHRSRGAGRSTSIAPMGAVEDHTLVGPPTGRGWYWRNPRPDRRQRGWIRPARPRRPRRERLGSTSVVSGRHEDRLLEVLGAQRSPEVCVIGADGLDSPESMLLAGRVWAQFHAAIAGSVPMTLSHSTASLGRERRRYRPVRAAGRLPWSTDGSAAESRRGVRDDGDVQQETWRR